MIKKISVRDKPKHNSRDNGRAQAYGSQYYVRHMVAIKAKIADLDMREHLGDLDSERDWRLLNTVGVHLPMSWTMSRDERAEICGQEFAHLPYSTCTPGYHVQVTDMDTLAYNMAALDGHVIERGSPAVVNLQPMYTATRTLTSEQRRQMIRNENVSRYGFSRV